MFVPCIFVQCFVSFLSSLLTKKTGCFTVLFFGCLATVMVMWLFLRVPWIGLQSVLVVLPDPTILTDFSQNMYNSRRPTFIAHIFLI